MATDFLWSTVFVIFLIGLFILLFIIGIILCCKIFLEVLLTQASDAEIIQTNLSVDDLFNRVDDFYENHRRRKDRINRRVLQARRRQHPQPPPPGGAAQQPPQQQHENNGMNGGNGGNGMNGGDNMNGRNGMNGDEIQETIDITSSSDTTPPGSGAAADTRENNNNDNYAVPNRATQSTYQRVDKGTKTALIYWDGWLTAEDAKAVDEDASYYGRAKAADKEAPKRNTNLKKNWTYGKNGEIVYIPTGFVGVFDKRPSNNSSSYGNLSTFVAQKKVESKHTGPSVGTKWDLHGNPLNRSQYADLTSSRANLGTTTKKEDDDYFGGGGGGSGKSEGNRNPGLKKNWTYGKNNEIIYIPTGFKGVFDKPAPGVSASSHGASSGTRSSYSNYGGSGPSGSSSYGPSPGSSYGSTPKSPGGRSGGGGGNSKYLGVKSGKSVAPKNDDDEYSTATLISTSA